MEIVGKTFNASNAYNPDIPCDANSVLCFSGHSDVIIRDCFIDGGNRQWGVKLSNCHNVYFYNCVFQNGYERAVDVVRGSNINFINCKWLPSTSRKPVGSCYNMFKACDVGIKGGVRRITFQNCALNDALFGDYCIYNFSQVLPPTGDIQFIECGNVIIRGLYVEGISYIATERKEFILPKVLCKLYFSYNKRWGDRRVLP